MTFTAHNVVSLFRAKPPVRDWDNAELAQFFRVEAALRQAGIFVDTERGLTDEGDPWFVYCRQDTGDVFLHIARFDGVFIAAGPSMTVPLMRRKFDELLDELVRDNPVILPPSPNRRPGPDLYIHPSTMLIAAVAALFYKNAPIRTEDNGESPLRHAEMRSSQGSSILSDVYSAALVSAMAIIAVLHHTLTETVDVDDRHPDELALLDGILFHRGVSGQDELPQFEGNVEPTGLISGGSPDAVDITSAGHIGGNQADTAFDVAASLQDLFGKFADTIVAASAAVSDTAELAVASHHAAGDENRAVADRAPAGQAGEALEPHPPASSAFVVAMAASFKSEETPVQQVSVSAAESQPVKEQAVVQMATATMPATVDMLTTTASQSQDGKGGQAGSSDGTDVDASQQPVVETPEQPIVEAPEPVFYAVVEAGGMFVLLSQPLEPVDTVGPEVTGADVSLVGTVDYAVDVLAMA